MPQQRISVEKKKNSILQIRRKKKQNKMIYPATVPNQSSSCYKNKLTELCHDASPRALPACVASRSHENLYTGVLFPQPWPSDPVFFPLILEVFHYCCGHVHSWRDTCFCFPWPGGMQPARRQEVGTVGGRVPSLFADSPLFHFFINNKQRAPPAARAR